MKAQVLTVLSVLFLGMTSGYGTVGATGDTVSEKSGKVECVVYTSQDGLLTFRMVKSPGEIVKVALYDAEGYLLVSRKFKRINNVKLSYDFSECPDGLYEIRVSNRDGIVFSNSVANPMATLANK